MDAGFREYSGNVNIPFKFFAKDVEETNIKERGVIRMTYNIFDDNCSSGDPRIL